MSAALFVISLIGAIFLFSVWLRKKSYRHSTASSAESRSFVVTAFLEELNRGLPQSLHPQTTLAILTNHIKTAYPQITVSSLIAAQDKLLFSAYLEEHIGQPYLDLLLRHITLAMQTLSSAQLPLSIETKFLGSPIDPGSKTSPETYCNIPVYREGALAAVITVSSKTPAAFTEDQMDTFYSIIHQAASIVGEFERSVKTLQEITMSVIENMKEGVILLDAHQQLIAVNSPAKRLLGISNGIITSDTVFSSLEAVYDLRLKVQDAISQKKVWWEKEIRFQEKSVSLSINPIFLDQSALPHQILIVLYDITAQKDRMQQKDDFTHMVVHELRAPMTAVKDAAEILIAPGAKYDAEQQKKLLQLIDIQSKRLLDQITEILDAAKLEAGKFTLDKIPSDIAKIIQERVEIFSPEAQKHRITLHTALEPSLPPLRIDPIRIAQVISNLLSNSLKFTPEGGTITVQTTRDTHGVKIAVSDTGTGIPKEQQPFLFSKYVQAKQAAQIGSDGKPAAKPKGTGLGLFIIKGIVEAHGGSIHLESEVGKGTTIYFYIPIEKTSTSQPESTPTKQPVQNDTPSAPPALTVSQLYAPSTPQ